MDQTRARQAIGLVDLTDLSDGCTPTDVADLCARAVAHGTAAVCVWPDYVSQAVTAVAESSVKVATVVNFPSGDERPFVVCGTTERAINDGAHEIDLVFPYRQLIAGNPQGAAEMVAKVAGVASGRATLKVILETGELADDTLIATAARLAINWGADFIKTSTGKTAQSASPDAVRTMLQSIVETKNSLDGRTIGLKPSGGIRTAADAETYMTLAAQAMGDDYLTADTFRFGASGLLNALIAAADGDDSVTSTASY